MSRKNYNTVYCILSQICSQSSTRNLVKMRSDLTFLSYIVQGYSFSWTQCILYVVQKASYLQAKVK